MSTSGQSRVQGPSAVDARLFLLRFLLSQPASLTGKLQSGLFVNLDPREAPPPPPTQHNHHINDLVISVSCCLATRLESFDGSQLVQFPVQLFLLLLFSLFFLRCDLRSLIATERL